jgi:hypothetical protein
MWLRIKKALPQLAPNTSSTMHGHHHHHAHHDTHVAAAAAATPASTGSSIADRVHSYRADVGTLVIFRGAFWSNMSSLKFTM